MAGQRASRSDRVVAVILGVGLAGVAAVQLFWALGGTWGVHAASGGAYDEPTTGLQVQSAVVAVLLVGACLLVLARVGLWAAPVPYRFVRVGVWVLTAALALGALANIAAPTDWERYGNGPIALVLAVLAFVVARSGERRRVHSPHAARPSH